MGTQKEIWLYGLYLFSVPQDTKKILSPRLYPPTIF